MTYPTSVAYPENRANCNETTCQASYPLNSENESPFGTFTVYLSCAEMVQLPTQASTPVIIGIVSILLPFIASTSFIKTASSLLCFRLDDAHNRKLQLGSLGEFETPTP